MSLASTVKSRRAELGISLQQLANRSGYSKAHIHQVEQGATENPSMGLVIALAAGLQMSAVALFREAMKEDER